MTAIAEAKEALRRLERDFTEQLQRFEDETGLKVDLRVHHHEWTGLGDQHRRWRVSVSATGEVVR